MGDNREGKPLVLGQVSLRPVRDARVLLQEFGEDVGIQKCRRLRH